VAGPGGQKGLPRRAAELGKRLNGLRPALCELGIEVRAMRAPDIGRQRRWLIAGPEAAAAAESQHA
jgi:hypothetical protein